MASREQYDRQVGLLVRLLPLLADEPEFALKGGTAINLFHRDLPRLSVDIDLTVVPVKSYEESLALIDAGMGRLADRIREKVGGQVNIQQSEAGHIERLHVQAGAAVKIEVTPVGRGVVFDPVMMAVRPVVQDRYGFAETWVVSKADLYAGKLVAALDRQHPRDLFDVKLLLENEGVDEPLRQAFVAYALGSRRPLHAIFNPPRRDLQQKYEQEFEGMAELEVSLEELLAVREEAIKVMVGEMPDAHRKFLLSFKRGTPEWELIGLPHMADLPAVRRRIEKLEALEPKTRDGQIELLEAALQG